MHTLAVPSLLSYDPVISALPPAHTPLASPRSSSTSTSSSHVHSSGGSSNSHVVNETPVPQQRNDVLNAGSEARERILRMSRVTPTGTTTGAHISDNNIGNSSDINRAHSKNATLVALPDAVTDTSIPSTIPPKAIRQSSAKKSDNTEALKRILQVTKSEAPEESEESISLLEERLSAGVSVSVSLVVTLCGMYALPTASPLSSSHE